ncbi:uncharacterized protein [Leuresthes tenuis]|uniref:uncharacterized protein n=1 Tax=Leuresthes tenuis TaxID=355514 RepID=UPI003B50600E
MTVPVGQNVTLTCPYQTSDSLRATFYWIRLVSGNWPEFLGGTYNFKFDEVNVTDHIIAKHKPENFILHLNGAQLSDTGLYYCFKISLLGLTLFDGTFLKIKGPEPDITAVIQEPPSDPVHPGDPVNLQCSVLFKSEKKTCSAGHSVHWFRAGSDESHPGLIYAHGNSGDGCERLPETNSTQKCVYSLSRSVSSSDAGTYYCAVAACGEIIFGNGAKLDIGAPNMWNLQTANTVLLLLCAAFITSLIVISVLIYTIKKKTCGHCNDAVTACNDHQSQQRDEVSLTYAAPTFTRKKAGRAERRNVKTPQEETVYNDVRVLRIH